MKRAILIALISCILGGEISATTAAAESLKIEVHLSNPKQLRIDFPLIGADKHYSALAKREGVIPAGFTWAGAKVEEVGSHDVYPGDQVRGTGYIMFTLPNGDQVSMKHEFVTSFLPAPDGKPAPVDHGIWTILGGTGSLAGIRGVGRFQIKRTSADPNVRIWELTGDIALVRR